MAIRYTQSGCWSQFRCCFLARSESTPSIRQPTSSRIACAGRGAHLKFGVCVRSWLLTSQRPTSIGPSQRHHNWGASPESVVADTVWILSTYLVLWIFWRKLIQHSNKTCVTAHIFCLYNFQKFLIPILSKLTAQLYFSILFSTGK